MCEGVELCNSIDWAEWEQNPVQVEICDACGTPMCASGGFVHVSRLGGDLLWTPPVFQAPDEAGDSRYAASYSLGNRGAVRIPAQTWGEWRRQFPSLPSFEHFPSTRRIDLVQGWTCETRGASRLESLDAAEAVLRERLIACDSMSIDEALQFVVDLTAWAKAAPAASVEGAIVPAPAAARIETLHFDGPGDEDWPAIARLPQLSLAFGRCWVFEPHGMFLG